MPDSATALLALLQYLLPSSTTATLIQPTDLVAAFVHAVHVSLRFRLDSTTDGQTADDQSLSEPAGAGAAVDDDAVSEADTAVADEQPGESVDEGFTSLGITPSDAQTSRLPSGWNSRGEDSYTYTYKHQQSQMTFTVKVGRIGNRVSVMGMAEDGEPHQLSVLLSDYVQSNFLPWPREDEPASRQRPLKEGFTSTAKLDELTTRLKTEIVLHQIPGIQVPGLTDSTSRGANPANLPPAGGAFPGPRAPQGPPRLPDEPRFPDSSRSGEVPYNPSIGRRDLDPTAAFQPPGMEGHNRPGFDPSHDGGGMLVDFNHPLFAGRRRGDSDLEGPGGLQNPPGARWDPVGPGFSTGPRSGGIGGPTGPMRGSDGLQDPDFDELLPPGEFGPDLRMPGQRGMGRPGRGGLGGGMQDPFGGGLGGGNFGPGRGGGGGFGGGGLGGGGFFM